MYGYFFLYLTITDLARPEFISRCKRFSDTVSYLSHPLTLPSLSLSLCPVRSRDIRSDQRRIHVGGGAQVHCHTKIFCWRKISPPPELKKCQTEKRGKYRKIQEKREMENNNYFQILGIFCCNAALRTTRGSPYVLCMSLLAFLPFTPKILRQPIPQNLWSYAIYVCGCKFG